MTDINPIILPRDAYIDENLCECGHSKDEHSDELEPAYMEEALRAIMAYTEKNRDMGYNETAHIFTLAEKGLNICAKRDCLCVKFEPVLVCGEE